MFVSRCDANLLPWRPRFGRSLCAQITISLKSEGYRAFHQKHLILFGSFSKQKPQQSIGTMENNEFLGH